MAQRLRLLPVQKRLTKQSVIESKGVFAVAARSELGPVINEVDRQLRGRLRGFDIARIEDGIVLLGVAPTFYVKQLAQHAVMQMTQLRILRNEIEVVEPSR